MGSIVNLLGITELFSTGRPLQGRTEFQGLQISIENRAGSVRQGMDRGGKPWRTRMQIPYGYIRGTLGMDDNGDQVDCFIGPLKNARKAYVVHVKDPGSGKYDEDKIFLGFASQMAAKRAFEQHYDTPEKYFGGMDTIPMDQFKEKVLRTRDHPQKLVAAWEMYMGGPGSGCNPEKGKCGRKPSTVAGLDYSRISRADITSGMITPNGKLIMSEDITADQVEQLSNMYHHAELIRNLTGFDSVEFFAKGGVLFMDGGGRFPDAAGIRTSPNGLERVIKVIEAAPKTFFNVDITKAISETREKTWSVSGHTKFVLKVLRSGDWMKKSSTEEP